MYTVQYKLSRDVANFDSIRLNYPIPRFCKLQSYFTNNDAILLQCYVNL